MIIVAVHDARTTSWFLISHKGTSRWALPVMRKRSDRRFHDLLPSVWNLTKSKMCYDLMIIEQRATHYLVTPPRLAPCWCLDISSKIGYTRVVAASVENRQESPCFRWIGVDGSTSVKLIHRGTFIPVYLRKATHRLILRHYDFILHIQCHNSA